MPLACCVLMSLLSPLLLAPLLSSVLSLVLNSWVAAPLPVLDLLVLLHSAHTYCGRKEEGKVRAHLALSPSSRTCPHSPASYTGQCWVTVPAPPTPRPSAAPTCYRDVFEFGNRCSPARSLSRSLADSPLGRGGGGESPRLHALRGHPGHVALPLARPAICA